MSGEIARLLPLNYRPVSSAIQPRHPFSKTEIPMKAMLFERFGEAPEIRGVSDPSPAPDGVVIEE